MTKHEQPTSSGARFRAWRLAYGFTYRGLHAELGLPVSKIHRLETGQEPKVSDVEAYASLFGITREQFFGFVPRPGSRALPNRNRAA